MSIKNTKIVIKKLLGDSVINKIILFKCKVIFIKNKLQGSIYNDFFFYPFNIFKPMPKTSLAMMKKACDILNSLEVNYFLADGTLLGIYRDNRLIPHDFDIDLSVVYPVDVKAIERKFKLNGFKIGRKAIAFGKIQQLCFFTDNQDLLDITFYTIINDYAYCFCEKDFYFKHRAHHYHKKIPHQFDHYTFNIPNDTEFWLEEVYGESWRIPKTSKPQDWREGGGVEYLAAVPFDGDFKKLSKQIGVQ